MFDIDFEKYALPKIYKRRGFDHFLDPIRQKLIMIKPEEIVRQAIVQMLINDMNVPEKMIDIEVPMSRFKKGARDRADIIVSGYNDNNEEIPVLVVECKEPNIVINDRTFKQVYRYDKIVEAGMVAVTNGRDLCIQAYDGDSEYIDLSQIPQYKNLVEKKGLVYDDSEPIQWKRPVFSPNYSNEIVEEFKYYENIGEETSPLLFQFIINLAGFIEDNSWEFEPQEINGIKIVEDLGLNYLAFSNSGGVFTNNYRCFMIEDFSGNNQVLSLRVHGLEHLSSDHKTCPNQKGNTHLVIAIDDEDGSRWSLQICLDKLCVREKKSCSLWHDLRTTVVSACKTSEVREYIKEKASELVSNNGKVFLGEFDNDKEISWDQSSTREFMGRLLKYALVREDFKRQKRIERKTFKC